MVRTEPTTASEEPQCVCPSRRATCASSHRCFLGAGGVSTVDDVVSLAALAVNTLIATQNPPGGVALLVQGSMQCLCVLHALTSVLPSSSVGMSFWSSPRRNVHSPLRGEMHSRTVGEMAKATRVDG